jgi:hypothetical protein
VWKLYSQGSSSPQWNAVPLDAVWFGTNAPPSHSIEAAVQLARFDRLLVVDATQTLFTRAESGVFLTPKPVTQAFPAWTGPVLALSHQQSAPDATEPAETVVLIGPAGKACLYKLIPADTSFQYVNCVALKDSDGGVHPNRASIPIDWSLDVWDDGQYKTAAYLQDYMKYGDFVHLFDATPAFTAKWTLASCPLFKGTQNPPPLAELKAGFYDTKLRVAYLVGP